MVMHGATEMKNSKKQSTKPAAKANAMDAEIARIASQILGLETLDTRNSDGLDFSDQAVWTIKSAFEAAYNAGKAAK